ncbi:hypothetical protein NC652_026127 [Populus alba x Populus x berolinensis]|uniref:Uncharacterized protein n=1 Tax=Populus alba x Populus x berolinensis TaxID=444605 RepID=A0AAD6ME86_9ROSI|nr:hypothetical protein NC652_026127 [Populus alba x Populus x berolinensis]KAJ6982682.1 hypothetical protein NC653_025709 [Populus alba x Populus x berolinensis]
MAPSASSQNLLYMLWNKLKQEEPSSTAAVRGFYAERSSPVDSVHNCCHKYVDFFVNPFCQCVCDFRGTHRHSERKRDKEQSQSCWFMSTSTTGWLVVLLLHRNHREMLDWFQMLLIPLDNSGGSGTGIGWLEYT